MTVRPPQPSPAYFQRIPKREMVPARARRGSTASRHPLLLVPSAERDTREKQGGGEGGPAGGAGAGPHSAGQGGGRWSGFHQALRTEQTRLLHHTRPGARPASCRLSGPATSRACTQPAGASVPRVQSRAAEPETRVALDSRSGPPLVAWREQGLDTGAAGREKQSALPTESRGGKGLETG